MKSDFMQHDSWLKLIATINLALDAIKNLKIFNDKDSKKLHI